MAKVDFLKRFSDLLCLICLYGVESILYMCMENDLLWTIVFWNKIKIYELNWFNVLIATTVRLGWRYFLLFLEKWGKFRRRMKNCETGEWLLPTRISNKSAKMDPSTVSSILPHLLHILVVENGLIFGYLLTVENGDICTFGWWNGTASLRNSGQLEPTRFLDVFSHYR